MHAHGTGVRVICYLPTRLNMPAASDPLGGLILSVSCGSTIIIVRADPNTTRLVTHLLSSLNGTRNVLNAVTNSSAVFAAPTGNFAIGSLCRTVLRLFSRRLWSLPHHF